MDEKSDRLELQRRLETAGRLIALLAIDDAAQKRLQKLAHEFEKQLR